MCNQTKSPKKCTLKQATIAMIFASRLLNHFSATTRIINLRHWSPLLALKMIDLLIQSKWQLHVSVTKYRYPCFVLSVKTIVTASSSWISHVTKQANKFRSFFPYIQLFHSVTHRNVFFFIPRRWNKFRNLDCSSTTHTLHVCIVTCSHFILTVYKSNNFFSKKQKQQQQQ